LRLGGFGLALAALALVVFGAIECHPFGCKEKKSNTTLFSAEELNE